MKTTIAELIEINDRNIKKLEKLSEKETDRFFRGMLTYAQSFDLDLHHFKKLEKGIIETIYQETCKGNPEPLNLTQSCENEFCDNGKIEMPYNEFISCSICENK